MTNNRETYTVALAGNPNVGKSTVFNALTGMHQHTGNWPGKTVSNAEGYFKSENKIFKLVDIPGTYSLFAHSPEEEIARNFICFGQSDAVIVVCDATCLERNLNLVLQTIETAAKVIVCVNLLDEAKRKGINIDLKALSKKLGVTVVGVVAKRKKSLKRLINALKTDSSPKAQKGIVYPEHIEKAIEIIENHLQNTRLYSLSARWLALQILQGDTSVINEINRYLNLDVLQLPNIADAAIEARSHLNKKGITQEILEDIITLSFVSEAEKTARAVTTYTRHDYLKKDQKIDRVLTSKKFGYPIMLFMLLIVFWITISGANYLSERLADLFAIFERGIVNLLEKLQVSKAVSTFITEGILRVPIWVMSVMLPPMAIFFPLFTLLEDAGFLPRIAFNLDKPFKRCGSCGKQSLTMCMGFGCNAAGVVGCRIIDSPRERLLAILTNSLVPCNGRFPTLITVISMFLVPFSLFFGKAFSALVLTAVILLGIFGTLFATRLLAKTLLKGTPSSYVLEIPPYRRPQLLRVLIRSCLDRTLFVLGRALTAAIPAGIVLWLMANIKIEGAALLQYTAAFLDPFAKALGLDGVILTAFILGLPANEIVLPIILMTYLSSGSLTQIPSVSEMQCILTANGWTVTTAICAIVFTLFHWPCSTTILTVKKETGSIKWTAVSILLPTAIGMVLCFIINLLSKLFSLI